MLYVIPFVIFIIGFAIIRTFSKDFESHVRTMSDYKKEYDDPEWWHLYGKSISNIENMRKAVGFGSHDSIVFFDENTIDEMIAAHPDYDEFEAAMIDIATNKVKVYVDRATKWFEAGEMALYNRGRYEDMITLFYRITGMNRLPSKSDLRIFIKKLYKRNS